MNLKNRIQQIEKQFGLEKNADLCRCDAQYLKIGAGHNCQNCGKPIDSGSFKGREIEVIEPKAEVPDESEKQN